MFIFLFIVARIVYGAKCMYLFCLCSTLFAIISLEKRELIALLCCVLNAMALLTSFDSSSQCHGLVCSM